ncbi:hypothetical protein ABIA69_000013 [Lysinibacillus parviboronicapiens]|uniref:Uncharacterized protein n=1 Tax=Lysinibacillus parviboronicapiens TaxID=436516 RepID=A0ABV2PD45_9BACI
MIKLYFKPTAAGYNGLHKKIVNVGILDYEFFDGVQLMREETFDPHSLVLSSLLFANKKPEILIEIIEELIKFNVSALAYKAVIFKDLPDATFSVEFSFNPIMIVIADIICYWFF